MEQAKLQRISFLARKAKQEALSPEEKAEQQALRQEYLEEIRKDLRGTLEHTFLVDEKGNKHKLKERPANGPDSLA